MIISLLITAVPSFGAGAPLPAAAALAVQADDTKEAEYKKRFEEAGADVAKLWDLSEWCDASGLREQRRDALKRILEIDPDHEAAHKGLRHHFYDGKWFETYAELSAYKRDEAKRMLEERGLVRYKDDWVPEADVVYLRLGWVKDENGKWASSAALERAKLEAEYQAKGWRQQTDLVWVPPDEFQQWEENRWKCGDQWLSLEEANAYHSEVGRWWTIPGQRFLILTTCDFDTGRQAANHADQVYEDLVRLFGLQPPHKPEVVILNSQEQYNTYAAGSGGRPQVEANGYSSCHYAFFAELQFGGTAESFEYKGGGVGYWSTKDESMAPFGKHSVRHAAAHSFLELADPSLDTISKAAGGGGGGIQEALFWAEKRIPRWLRYGAASYVERYYQDAYAEEAWWPRKWAIGNLLKGGEIDPFERIFALELNPNDSSGRIISEAGLVVSFILDGKCPPVVGVHRKLKAMLLRGENTAEAVEELQKTLIENRPAFDAYVQSVQG